MVRRVKDPWAKKTKKGMKSLGTIGKLAVGTTALVGTTMAHEINSAKKKPQSEPVPINAVSVIIILAGTIIGASIGFGCVGGFWGFIVTIIIVMASLFIGMIVGVFVGNSSSSAIIPKQQITEQPIVEAYSNEKLTAIKDLLFNMAPYKDYENELASLSIDDKKELLMKALNEYYAEISTSMEIPQDSEHYTDGFIKSFSLPIDKIQTPANKSYLDYLGALNLHDILNGITPKRVTISHPINLAKDEQPLWVFPAVGYYEEVTSRTNAGATRAVSVRIAKGIYYHTGAFKGEPIITSSLKAVATGDMIITNKCIYLYSRQRSVKYPINKILAYVPFEDGIGLQPDKPNAKTVYFRGLDGTYAYNVVSNIKNLELISRSN